MKEEREDTPPIEEVMEQISSSAGASAKHDAILYQMRGLFIGYAGLEYLNRVIQQADLDYKDAIPVFHERAEAFYTSLGRYNSALLILDPKNIKRIRSMPRPRRYLQRIILDMLQSATGDGEPSPTMNEDWRDLLQTTTEEAEAYEEAAEIKYMEIEDVLYDDYKIDPDPIIVAAWFGFNLSLARAYEAGYDSFRILMQDVNRMFGYEHFRITKAEYAKHLEDLKYENIRGDQSTSIDEKAILQLIVYAAWNNLEIDEPIEITFREKKSTVTLQDVFKLAGKVDCFGWLKEFHKVKIEWQWEKHHNVFKEILTEVRGPLREKFQKQIELTQQVKPTKVKLAHLEKYSCAFQITKGYAWMSGMLPNEIQMEPYNFSLKPSNESSNVTFISGLHGSGKTTLLSGIAALAVLEYRQVVLNVLAENTNAMTLAFLPQFEIPDKKRANPTCSFIKELGIKPQGVPVLILDIVKDLDELNEQPLTTYDRVIRVEDYENFSLDIDKVLAELKIISQKFGYSTACGIVTVRNLGRKGTGYDCELKNAISVLNAFLKWRVNNKRHPFRLQIDEAAEAGTSQAYSVENISMKQRLEEAIRTTRRGNFAMDIATQLTGEISPTVRNETANNFWKNLRETGERRRSPLDVLLDSLSLEEGFINSIKMLNKDPQFRNSYLMFWHEMSTMELNVIQPVPPPFMVQVSDMSILEVYKAYLKSHPDEEDFILKGRPNIWLDLSERRHVEDNQNSRWDA